MISRLFLLGSLENFDYPETGAHRCCSERPVLQVGFLVKL